MTRSALILLVAIAALIAGCGGSHHQASPSRTVPQLRSLGQLKSAFNAHAGQPRLLVLLSPT